jgi:hypothetical protein
MRIDVSYNKYKLKNPHKYQKSQKNLKNTLKNVIFVTHVTKLSRVKSQNLIRLKSRRFWHHRELCSMLENYSNRDLQTHRQTDTIFFYCFIVLRDLENVQKSHKKWRYENFIFHMNSILRHSKAKYNFMLQN